MRQILLTCTAGYCPQAQCFMLYLLNVRQNDSNANCMNEFCNWTHNWLR